MISPAWEIGGAVGRLSRVVHPWSSRKRLFAMLELTAYLDESETEHRIHCVAGYWATARAWEGFEALWKARLKALGLAEFHAADCEHGKGEYKGRTDRPAIRESFIEIIDGSLIHGVMCAIDLRGWDPVADEVAHLRRAGGMGDPYYVAFQMAMEAIAGDVRCFSPEERVALVFDDRPDAGKVVRLYQDLKSTTIPDFKRIASRLGSVTNAASEEHPGLQAADLLAYESNRYLVEVRWAVSPKAVRSGWPKLRRKGLAGGLMTEAGIPELLDAMEVLRPGANFLKEDQERKKAERTARGAERARARNAPSARRSPEKEPPEGTS